MSELETNLYFEKEVSQVFPVVVAYGFASRKYLLGGRFLVWFWSLRNAFTHVSIGTHTAIRGTAIRMADTSGWKPTRRTNFSKNNLVITFGRFASQTEYKNMIQFPKSV